MNINVGPSALGLQHMAARAQEVRKQSFPSPSETAAVENGNNVAESGNSLPPAADTSVQKPEHLTGLERALERLQMNASKSPEAKGLQNALEMLQRNQDRASTVDTEA
jgi:hypothetical protein